MVSVKKRELARAVHSMVYQNELKKVLETFLNTVFAAEFEDYAISNSVE